MRLEPLTYRDFSASRVRRDATCALAFEREERLSRRAPQQPSPAAKLELDSFPHALI